MPEPTIQAPLFTSQQIQRRVRELAQEIDRDYPPGERLHLVAVLNGAFMFLSDLVRAMTRPVSVDFIALSSYGAGMTSSGHVRMLKDISTNLQDRHVIIVEDIVDSGRTLAYLQKTLNDRSPKSLKTVCLLSRSSRRSVNVTVDYTGFEIDDQFVVGYGLDVRDQFRSLPYIAALSSETDP